MESLNKIVVTEVTEVITVFSPKGRITHIDNRRCYGLSFCDEGQITYKHKGKNFISNNKNIIILPQGQSYTLSGDKTGIFRVINFTCQGNLCDTFRVFPIQNSEIFINEYEQIKELLLFGENRAKIMSIFYGMIHRLSYQEKLCNTIVPAVKYIEKNYKDQNLTNEILAKECNISEVYLRKLFNKHLQTTPKQYIAEIRLQKARQLLTEGVLKISAISEECGFTNPYHFCRIFKQKTGLTPSEFMKQNKIYKI